MMTMSGSAMPQPASNIQRRARPEDSATHITVSDPVQHSDGLNKYTSYRVDVRPPSTTSTSEMGDVILSPSGGGPTSYSSVLRRYSEFLWLYERLHAERAGAIVPPLPEKQPVGRFSPAFVEDRRVNLERFLRRCVMSPELGDAACLDTFLRADDVTFQAMKNTKGTVMAASQANFMQQPHHHVTSQPKKDGFKRWFAEAKTSMTGDLVKSPDDDLFEEIARYIHGLDVQMRNVSQQASGLVRKGKEIANGLFEFGLAFNLLGQSEADALGDALCNMGETSDRLSVLSAEHAEKELVQFEQPLQDYIKTIHGVKLALQRRHEKRLTYSTCLSEVETKQNALARLRSQIGSEAKAYQMEMSLRRGHEAAEVARDDFATVSQRVLREVDRFKRDKAEDMRRTVLDYINLQVDYNKRMEQVWATLIPKLERVQLDSNSNAVPVSPENSQSHEPPAAGPGMQQQQQQQQHNPVTGYPGIQAMPSQPPPAPPGVPPQQQGGYAQQSMYAMQQPPQPPIQQSHEIPQYDTYGGGTAPPPPMGGNPGAGSTMAIQYRAPQNMYG